jgi:hypothetical protein
VIPADYPAVSLTIWSGKGIKRSFADAEATILRVKPQALELHSGWDDLSTHATALASMANQLVPGIQITLGLTGDVGLRQAKAGTLSPEQLLDKRLKVCRAARAAGAYGVTWNCEPAWKSKVPGFTEADARLLVQTTKAQFPELVQAHTSYDCPTLHSSYCWAGWHDCDVHKPQIYWAFRDVEEPRGTGAKRLALHRKHWDAAVRKGWLPSGTVIPYLQVHHCNTMDLCSVANDYSGVSAWAVPSRMTESGIVAMAALAEIDRRGFRGPGRVQAFQRSAGLTADGLVGPRTLAALGAK